jgi:prepilin-type N-terminal cleavage/methylation domain-containing protein
MRRKKGVTLAELLIALVLLGMMVIFIGSIGNSLFSMKKQVLDKNEGAIQGNVALATIFERVLRSDGGSEYAITDGGAGPGTKVTYKVFGRLESIYLAPDPQNSPHKAVYYNDGTTTRKIIGDVEALHFGMNWAKRLEVDLELTGGENFRTAVAPRNAFTPGSVIN